MRRGRVARASALRNQGLAAPPPPPPLEGAGAGRVRPPLELLDDELLEDDELEEEEEEDDELTEIASGELTTYSLAVRPMTTL